MYYLQSRYYDAGVGRFISADEVVFGTYIAEHIISSNIFAYADNNPVLKVDVNGFNAIAAYDVSSALYAQMVALAAAGTSLLISLKSLLAMLWNIFAVVGLLLIAIAAIVCICKSISKIRDNIKSRVNKKQRDDYKKYKSKICVYVLTRKSNPLQSIFYVGRTKNIIARYSKHSSPSSKYYKGDFYMFVIYVCTSEAQSKVVEQAVLSACLVGEFTQIVFGQAPSNKIRGIAKSKAKTAIGKLKKDTNETLSLLGCKSESDLLYLMNQ